LDPITAIHEAGHAVARYLTATDMGRAPDESIAYIEIAPGTPLGVSFDRRAALVSQAVTYGPMFSPEIDKLIGNARELKAIVVVVAEAVAKGLDISKWLEARSLIAVFGPMAEAVASQKSFDEVWDSYPCEGDVRSFAQDCVIAGLGGAEIDSLFGKTVEKAVAMFHRPEICAAINVLAAAFPNAGRMDGKEAAVIISGVLALSERDGETV
jgi:hypothetical protein